MEIRTIVAKDLDNGFLDLLQQLTNVGTPSSKDLLERLDIITKTSYIYVVLLDGRLVGTGKLFIEPKLHNNLSNMGHIEDVVVDKNNRGRGIGLLIVNTLIVKARELNCYKIVANCSRANIPFYQKCGMNEKGTEMCFYF